MHTKIKNFRELFLSEKKTYSSYFYKNFGLRIGNCDTYFLAFVHSSCEIKNDSGKFINNERLEYLGDAIIDSIVSDYLFSLYPDKNEGFLTQMRSKIVSRDSLNEIAAKMNINILLVAKLETDKYRYIAGNTLEAIIGAIYKEKGYKRTKKILVKRIIEKHLDINKLVNYDTNYKSKLIDIVQKEKISFEYNTYEDQRNSDMQMFISDLYLEKTLAGTGTGASKKEAEQSASKDAISNIENEIVVLERITKAN